MRSHRKSRHGCKDCKDRKIKCDETKPACVKCKTAGRSCSYLTLRGNLPKPLTPLQPSQASTPGSPYHLSVFSVDSTNTPPPVPDECETPGSASDPTPAPQTSLSQFESYSLFHLDLLDHFRGTLTDITEASHSYMGRIFRLTYKEALRRPYLMDEVLAYTAAHKSTLVDDADSKVLYHTEATRLQSRAITNLGMADEVVTEDNFLALFIFSVLLGQHVLFDAFSSAASLPAVLDKLVHCLGIHHGISAIAGEAMEKFAAVFQQQLLADPAQMKHDVTGSPDGLRGSECDDVLRRLQASDMSDAARAVYVRVVEILQYQFDSARDKDSWRFVAVQDWPVRISNDYISLLKQRRPEALVILGYYAVLLHRAREFWVVGDSGRFLIRAISNHLGSYWADWLEWPNQELNR
ncbi:C6 finger domain-containing protein [Colletotrichum musicola]|uniref:C6 finger domain-containing protein n=1 Tax=Colletotrichum musicola TaxID=2175873 RepID=A0A8H6NGE1_9PEZI|nr:C6 finger domain-containing protein [Colletotrichum musicola]